MGPAGRLVTIKRSGADGPHFPLSLSSCLFGRAIECDIRIQLPVVSKQHCKIEINDQKAVLFNFSSANPTQVNGLAIGGPVQLKHGDVITVVDRSFRYEDDSHQSGSTSAELPGQRHGQAAPRRVSRSSFSSNPDNMEGVPLKARRVSFGGHLRPELFDENLPPNTPLKRGETPKKRRSLVAHAPAVLKKIVQPQAPGKEDSLETRLEVTAQNAFLSSPACHPTKSSSVANDGRRRSSKPPASSGSQSPHQTGVPKRGGRRSSGGSSKRASSGRSQHGTLQMIHSRRRSGASEANLMVAKSWADIVKLSAKQTQTKVVKHGPPRQPSKRQRRINTPKTPAGRACSEFSTGHANSPCTIVIGKAHVEKVTVPARPYRMLNNLVFNKRIDFDEDLSGLAEMFKTPAKEKPKKMSSCPTTFSNSEGLLGRQVQVPTSEQPLLRTPAKSGENVFPSAQNARGELSGETSASPTLRRQYMTVNKNMDTPPPETEPSKAASSVNRSRRSAGLRDTQVPGAECEKEDTEVETVESILGRCLRKSPVQAQLVEGEMKESETAFATCKRNIESKENSAKKIVIRRSTRSSGLKCAPRADVIATKRLQETESKEDLVGIHCFLQTPGHAEAPVHVENKATVMGCRSPKPEPVRTPTKMNGRIETPSQSVRAEALSVLRKPTQTPGHTKHTHKEPVGGDESMKPSKKSPEQQQASAEHVTRRRGRSRTPKRKVELIEDLVGFKELFQTPNHVMETVTNDKTTKIPSKSPKPEPVHTPTSTKRRLRTPLGKVHVEEELSALRKSMPTPGETPYSTGEPEGDDDEDIKALEGTPEQKQDSAEYAAGSRRRSRTPKRKVELIEDLAGFKELFQTPNHIVETVTNDKTTKIPSKSPKPEPVCTPTSTKRHLRTPLGIVDVEEELSALRKSTPTPGETTHSPGEPEGDDDEDIKALEGTPGQKQDSAEHVARSRRRSRTPKRKAEPVEDLTGFKELFQTPNHTDEPMTEDITTKIPSKSPKPEPVSSPTKMNGWIETPSQSVSAEALSVLRKPTQTPGHTKHTHKEPVGGDESMKPSKKSPEQQQDSAEHVTGRRGRSRTPKRKVELIEDLAGFKELIQTPNHTDEPMTEDITTKNPSKSPKPEPVCTPTSTKRHPRTSLGKVHMEEELSALRKSMPTPGETVHSPGEPEGDDVEDIKALEGTAEQKRDSAEHATGRRKRSRTPKRKVELIEDLAGFKELFQTPNHVMETVTNDKTTKIPSKSPKPEPVYTPTSTKRRHGTPLGKVDMEEELLTLRKSIPTPGETTHSPGEPEGDDECIRALEGTPGQKRDSAEHVARSRRRSRTPKRKVEPVEDLTGFKELFQTPNHTDEPMTEDITTKIPSKSPKPEPVSSPTKMNGWIETPSQSVRVEALSVLRKPTQTPGHTKHAHKEPVGGDESMKPSKKSPEQQQDSAEHVTGRRGRSRTPKRKVEPIEDLVGFKELFQTPNHVMETVTNDKTTKIPSKSPKPEPVCTPTSTKRHLRTPLGKVDVEEGLSALRKSTPTPGETTHSPGEPEGDDEDIRALEGTPGQKRDLAEHATGSRRRSRTPTRVNQPIEDLAGFKELFQTPKHTVESTIEDKATKMPCKSAQGKPAVMPTGRNRRLKAPPGKVAIKDEPSVLWSPTWASRKTTRLHREQEGGDKDTKLFKESPEQKLDPAENVTASKRRPRTCKEKAQFLADPASLKELLQIPNHTEDPVAIANTTEMPSRSPQAEAVTMPARTRRQLKAPPGTVAIQEEPTAFRRPTRTTGKTTWSHREQEGGDKDMKLFKESPEQKLDPAENVTASKRRPRTCKEKAQFLADPASLKELLQIPNHTEDPVAVANTTEMPSRSPQAEAVTMPARTRRQLKAPPGAVAMKEEPAALRRPTRTTGKTTRSHREPVDGAKDIKVCKGSPRREPGPVGNAVGSGRLLRSRKGKAQPPHSPADSKQLLQSPALDKEPGTDAAAGVTRMSTQTPDQSKPVTTSRRALRALNVKPTEELADSRDPVKSQSDSSIALSPKRKCEDGSCTGLRRLRSRACAQDTAEKPPQKRQRTAPREQSAPPEPSVPKKRRRVLREDIEPVDNLPSANGKTKYKDQEDTTSAHKGVTLCSSLPDKTNGAEQRPELLTSAGKVQRKRNEKKPVKSSQEVEIQNPEGGAQNSAPGDKVHERRMSPRPGSRGKVPVPRDAEEKARASSAETRGKAREEKEGPPHSGFICLRSRKVTAPPPGATLETKSKQRVTRSAKRLVEDANKQENDDGCIKKMRTRSRRGQ
ncbi:proliferation marker protein Ki-67 isoform X3 [Desmodus rotundus]|uniref:proliferation marker protein Ki-67 isoform X3 n=1 Tax=Desmodus rotundus TaxID=9430 RepID=UPI0023810EA6|nr:proliferation marker protein Ki-67 isoform X3 [Desmodus rotundus]